MVQYGMTILSDTDIRGHMDAGRLIQGGDRQRAVGSAYQFRPGLIVRTGQSTASRSVLDWTGQTSSTDIYRVGPGELVWVRTVEHVLMPANMCAFWWQSNRLSRQGLMLVNMSMVEPNYSGRLACLFVNFGRRKVVLTPTTVVAKLVFHQLSGDSTNPPMAMPTPHDYQEYDRDLVGTAMQAPKTFLDLRAIGATIVKQREQAIKAVDDRQQEFEAAAAAERLAAIAEIKQTAEDSRKMTRDDIVHDTNRTLRRAFGWAALGVALLIVATSFIPTLQALIKPDLQTEISDQVENALNSRVGQGIVPQQIAQLQQRIAELELQLSGGQSPSTAPPTP